MSSGAAAVEVYVKAKPGTGATVLGDCPFSARVLLTLEEKAIAHTRHLIDFSDKPQWFLEANPEGKVPVLHHEGKWIADSDVICEHLEGGAFPDARALSPADESTRQVGAAFFGAFVKFFTNGDAAAEPALRDGLAAEVKAIDAALQGKTFLGGDDVCSVDLALYPKLRHMAVACGHYKGFAVPQECAALASYMKAMAKRPSVVDTYYPDEYILEGWQPKLGLSNL